MKKSIISQHRSRSYRFLILLSIIALFSITLCIFIVYRLFLSDRPAKSNVLTVPNLTGTILRNDLPYEINGFQTVRISCYDNSPAGTVLSQFPKAGSKRRGSDKKRFPTLTLYVSKGQRSVSVPSLIGKSAEDAVCDLIALGLSHSRQEQYSNAPTGTVIAQDVKSESLVKVGSVIAITISLGRKSTETHLPSFSGLTEIQAKSLTEAIGLRIGSIEYQEMEEHHGKVISQFPPPNTRVIEGATIILTVAKPAPDAPDNSKIEAKEQLSPIKPPHKRSSSEKASPEAPENDRALEDLLERFFHRFDAKLPK